MISANEQPGTWMSSNGVQLSGTETQPPLAGRHHQTAYISEHYAHSNNGIKELEIHCLAIRLSLLLFRQNPKPKWSKLQLQVALDVSQH